MRALDELTRLYTSRRNAAAAQHGHWRDLANVYDGGLVTPMPEYDEVAESSVPGLVSQGIDSYARRYAEQQPAVSSPAMRPNIAASRRKASERSKVIRGWWCNSFMPLADYQRGRYFFGYGAMPVILRSHATQVGVPVWEALNPMGVLPGPKPLDYSPMVQDGFTASSKSLAWLDEAYGVKFTGDARAKPETLVQVVEYVDAEQVTVFCVADNLGTAKPVYGNPQFPYGFNHGGLSLGDVSPLRMPKNKGWCVPLSSTPNYARMCTLSYPGAISLSKVMGLVDGILGMHHMQARLMALTFLAITRGIFPSEFIVSQGGNGPPNVVREADPRRGIAGIIEDGTVVMNQIQPGYQTWNLIDRLEANQRSTAGIVPQFGGQNPVNVRTGAASAGVSGAAVDPVIAEAHVIAQAAREHENRVAVAIAKGYGGSRPISLYVAGKSNQAERLDYTPAETFETDETVVRYSLVGADAQGMIIASAQSVGTEMMSKHRARVLNPLVEDPESEAIAIRAETAEGALLGSLAELVATSPEDASFILRRLRQGEPPEDVWDAAQKRAQERQASAGELGAPDGPVPAGDPLAQPGLGLPGGGAEAPVAVEEPPPSARNLAALMTASRRPAMVTPAERAG